jgi:hypothetical protein
MRGQPRPVTTRAICANPRFGIKKRGIRGHPRFVNNPQQSATVKTQPSAPIRDSGSRNKESAVIRMRAKIRGPSATRETRAIRANPRFGIKNEESAVIRDSGPRQ